jgi:hypothetical protein|tara:strand:- start:915 stop:1148 length:234 start_codon:yes stop_codon:yes gene_type:complete|eukprot:SAG11_NODE_148_length_14747_cov_217.933517_3_plen_78_part_00
MTKLSTLTSNNVIEITKFIERQFQRPLPLPSYLVADLPNPELYINTAIIVSNETGGRTIATSDGSNWKRVKDGATVS